MFVWKGDQIPLFGHHRGWYIRLHVLCSEVLNKSNIFHCKVIVELATKQKSRTQYDEELTNYVYRTWFLERKAPTRSEFSLASIEHVLYTSTPPGFTNLRKARSSITKEFDQDIGVIKIKELDYWTLPSPAEEVFGKGDIETIQGCSIQEWVLQFCQLQHVFRWSSPS